MAYVDKVSGPSEINGGNIVEKVETLIYSSRGRRNTGRPMKRWITRRTV
jgi:hypothetical protein